MLFASGNPAPSVRLSMKRSHCPHFCLVLLLVMGAFSLRAKADSAIDEATIKGTQAYGIRGEQLDALEDVLKFPFEVEVNTNGTFKVSGGRERKLQEGQVIRRDGWLVNPDGTIRPVFDHVGMIAGRVTVVRDGQAQTSTERMVFPNGLTIDPDGSCVFPDGNRSRLADGQLFRLDGTSIPPKDSATFKNGRVVVQKSGTLIALDPTLASVQAMGMSDGSRVQGNGTIRRQDGTIIPLPEGKTVLFAGINTGH
jgi:hypothetical protein